MATQYLKLRAVAALIAAGALLPVACAGDDDTTGNQTPSTGGTGAKGGAAGKGGSSAKGGTSGDAGDNGSGGTGNSANGGSAGKGGSSGRGGSSNVGGSGNVSGDGSGDTGNEGGTSPGTGGTDNIGGDGGDGNPPPPEGCTEADLTNDDPPCYESCDAKQTDDSLEFLNHCADGSQTLAGVEADCTPWTGALSALGDGCTHAGGDCVLPALP